MKKILFICTLFLLLGTSGILAQTTYSISGEVLDEFNEGLPGVNVYVKNSPGVGTTTDLDGKFRINASEYELLVISFIGYENYEYRVTKNEENLIVKLTPQTTLIDETVIVGTGVSQRKISSVGAVTSVDVSQLQTPGPSLINNLGGRVAGIITKQTSGEPGKNISEFWVRGIGTFGANSGALVLIDGLEGDLNNIDVSDVESFSVLKDASATAVYGVRGANGVVLVTTKRGNEEKLSITGRASWTISQLKRMPEYLGAYDYAVLANEARLSRGETLLYTDTELDIIRNNLDPDLYPNVNWRDEIMNKSSLLQNYYVSARGGGSIARYFLSLNTSSESSAYKQDKHSKYAKGVGYFKHGFRANIDMNITKTSVLYFGVDANLSSLNQPGMADTDALWSAQAGLTPLTIPTVYSDGSLPAYGTGYAYYSPYVALNETGSQVKENYYGNYTLALQQDLSFITSGLHLKVQGAYTNTISSTETRFVLPDLYQATGRNVNGTLTMLHRVQSSDVTYAYNTANSRKYHLEAHLNYSKIVKDDHRFSGLVYYYMSDSKNTDDFWGKENAVMLSIPKRYQGLSSRFTYGFKDTYLLDVNFGYTGSENFQSGRRFGFFPSVAGGWIPSQYNFVNEKLPWLDFLKIRASYGLVGNDQISDSRFPYLTLASYGNVGWGGGEGINETQVGADNLRWEKAKKFDLGFEGKLLGQRLEFEVDYFVDRRDGIFQQRAQIPEYVGLYSLPYGNVGQMKSYGADGTASFFHKINNDMSFTVRGNFTLAKNKVLNWEQEEVPYDYQQKSGFPYNYVSGLVAIGLFKDEEDVANSPAQQFGSYMAGDIKYKDINGDGIIDSDDKVPLSYDNTPRLMYGFGGEFTYRKLTLGVLFKGVGNVDQYHVGWGKDVGYIPFYSENYGNVLSIVADPSNRWIPASVSGTADTENPNARFPRLSYGANNNNSQFSSFWKSNGRYLRLQEVSLSYRLGAANTFLSKLGVSSVDIQLIGNNLYIWDKIKHWDPEQGSDNGVVYPIPATYSLQLYINF